MNGNIYKYVMQQCAVKGVDFYDVKKGSDIPHLAIRNGIISGVYRKWGYEGAYLAGKMLGRSKSSVMRTIEYANYKPEPTPYFDSNKFPPYGGSA